MRRIAEGFELPSDWGFFTNEGMTLDTADPLFGLGSAKYDAANIEFATSPILRQWDSYYFWQGFHFKMEEPESSTPNWLCGWRSENTPGSVVEGGCIGVVDSKLCLGLNLGEATPTVVATGRKTISPDTLYHIQPEIWYASHFGWGKIKLQGKVLPDLVFNGVTAVEGEIRLSGVWIGSLYGGGNGQVWIDDYVFNDHQTHQQNQDRGYPGMVIVHSVESSGDGAYAQWRNEPEGKIVTTPLAQPRVDQAEGVSETPITCDNVMDAEVGAVIAVHGPITDPVFENETSSESISITGEVPDGSRLIVNTAAHNVYLITPTPSLDGESTQTVITDYTAFVSGTPDWFMLAPGANSINVTGAAGNTVFVGWVAYEVGPTDSFTFDPKPAAPTAPMGSAGLVSVDHIYRMKLEGEEVELEDKIIPGIRRDATDYFATRIEEHLFPTSDMACHVDRMRRDRATSTPWNPANIDETEALFQYSNYSDATAQSVIDQENFGAGTGDYNIPTPPVVPPAPVIPPEPTPPPQPFPPVSPPELTGQVNFQLRPGSPALDFGVALAEVTTDLRGRARDASPSAGAFEGEF